MFHSKLSIRARTRHLCVFPAAEKQLIQIFDHRVVFSRTLIPNIVDSKSAHNRKRQTKLNSRDLLATASGSENIEPRGFQSAMEQLEYRPNPLHERVIGSRRIHNLVQRGKGSPQINGAAVVDKGPEGIGTVNCERGALVGLIRSFIVSVLGNGDNHVRLGAKVMYPSSARYAGALGYERGGQPEVALFKKHLECRSDQPFVCLGAAILLLAALACRSPIVANNGCGRTARGSHFICSVVGMR
jgi:hypothetical protein